MLRITVGAARDSVALRNCTQTGRTACRERVAAGAFVRAPLIAAHGVRADGEKNVSSDISSDIKNACPLQGSTHYISCSTMAMKRD